MAHLPAASGQQELELLGADEVGLLGGHRLLGDPGETATSGEILGLPVAPTRPLPLLTSVTLPVRQAFSGSAYSPETRGG